MSTNYPPLGNPPIDPVNKMFTREMQQFLIRVWNAVAAGGGGNVSSTGSPSSGNLAVWSGATSITNGNLTGDVTTSNTTATTIAANAVTDAKFRQSAGLSVVGRSANSTGNVADVVAASDGQVLRRSGTAVGFGAVDLANANAVTGVLPSANGGIPRVVMDLTDADILALPTTPFEILPAAAAGFRKKVIAMSVRFNTLAGAYMNLNPVAVFGLASPDMVSGWWSVNPLDATTDLLGLLGTTRDNIVDFGCPLLYAGGYPSAADTSDAINLSIDNSGSGDLTGGNAANSLRVTVYYVIDAL